MRTIPRVLCAVALAGLTIPGNAAAAPPPGVPAIDQYIEAVPTSAGPRSTAAEEHVQPLPPAVARRVELEAGSDAETLTEVATSARYGAPVRPRSEAQGPARRSAPVVREGRPPKTSEHTALDAVRPEQPSGGDARLVTLVSFMAATLLAVLAYQLVRRRSGASVSDRS
jgi:hypothetical protein